MRGHSRQVILLICICMVLLGGCAKKKITPQGGEVYSPSPYAGMNTHDNGPPTDFFPNPLDMPGAYDAGSDASSAALEEEIRNFNLKDVYFSFDQFFLDPEGRKVCSQTASFLKVHPQFGVVIEGHCDERGTIEYNLALGERRAGEVKNYLVFLGIAENRISTITYGKEKPQDLGHNEEAWAKNRRAHFKIVGGGKS